MVTATNRKLDNGGWAYGDAGDKWQVKPGDIWEAGPAILACGDLQRGAATELFKNVKIDLFYSDPPWDPGNAKSFRTKAGLNEPGVKVNFPDLLIKVVEIARQSSGDTYLEMGKKNAELLEELVKFGGGRMINRWDITYYKKNPMVLFQFVFEGAVQRGFTGSASGMDDGDTPMWAIARSTSPGDLVADTCTGRGLTMRSAVEQGRRFIGTELNPRRLAVAIDWMAQHGHAPMKVGELACMKEQHHG